jgi:diacylglycerol kinase family enzyme
MTSIAIDPASPLFVVLNEGSGNADTIQRRQAIESVLKGAGRPYKVFAASGGAALRAWARQAVESARRRGGVVVAAGGDGTLNTVAQAVIGSDIPFGVVPQGTFNYFGRTHRIPEDTVEAAQVLLGRKALPVQVGLVNDRVFLVNASLGLYPQVLEDREAYTKQYGRSRSVALYSGVMALMREHRQLRLQIESGGEVQVIRTPTLFIGNNRLQLDQLGMPQAEALDEGRLAAIALKPVDTLALLGLLLRGAFGRLGNAENLNSFTFRRMVVKPWLPYGTQRIKVAIDGEVTWLRAPLEFRVSPRPLYLLVPDAAPDEADVEGRPVREPIADAPTA